MLVSGTWQNDCYLWGFPGGSVVENPPANAGDASSIPGLGRFPWRRAWQPTPVFLPENPMDSEAWQATVRGGHKELDTLSMHTGLFVFKF